MRIDLPSERKYPRIVGWEQAGMGMTDYRTNQNDPGGTHSEDAAFPG
jgi:hypothetical protein